MTSLVSPVVLVKPPAPVTTHAYFDKVALWLPRPLDKSVLKQLKANAGHVHVGNYRARFNPRLVQRVELKQPSESALQALTGLPVYINKVEVALDLIFKNARERDQAYEFLDLHLVRRWHGKTQQIRVHPGAAGTRYDGPRYAANSIVVYREHHSRVSGELDCLHVEWRASKRRAVAALGINSIQDALRFDHRRFWEKRLLFFTIEPERLGRYLRNRAEGKRSRTTDSRDGRKGGVIIRSAETVQEIIDRYGDWLRIQRVLTPINNSDWLPSRRKSPLRRKSKAETRKAETRVGHCAPYTRKR